MINCKIWNKSCTNENPNQITVWIYLFIDPSYVNYLKWQSTRQTHSGKINET